MAGHSLFLTGRSLRRLALLPAGSCFPLAVWLENQDYRVMCYGNCFRDTVQMDIHDVPGLTDDEAGQRTRVYVVIEANDTHGVAEVGEPQIRGQTSDGAHIGSFESSVR